MNLTWLTDVDGVQYINNPNGINHASRSYDGVTWQPPIDEQDLARRQKRIDEIIRMAKINVEAERERHGDKPQTLSAQIERLRKREKVCWDMSEVFLHSRDAHGIHDMGVEIQGIQWAIRELEKALLASKA